MTVFDFLLYLIMLLFISFGLGIAGMKLFHPNYSMAECTRRIKSGLREILSVLFSSNTARHIFDTSLWENLLKILKVT